jgi:hypothetical protein
MRIMRETSLPVSPRAIVVSKAKNFHITPERHIPKIVGTSSSVVGAELAEAHTAWRAYQSTRRRDAVYDYLMAVFKLVRRWRKQQCAKARSHQALRATGHRATIRNHEPFSAVIFCTSDSRIVDTKTRSKWSRALRYAEGFKPDDQSLARFIKSQGGLNECASRWSDL